MTIEEAIKKLQKQKAEYLDEWVDYSGVAEAFDMAIEALKSQGWNPVSKRLPNQEGLYLITSETGAVTTARWYMPSEWRPDGFWGRVGKKKTVAWMPMPEPYKGGEK